MENEHTFTTKELRESILKLGKVRERAIYIRPDGVRTSPLPADLHGKAYYMGKGFVLAPPEEQPNVPKVLTEKEKLLTQECICPVCQAKLQNALQLHDHIHKSHIAKSETTVADKECPICQKTFSTPASLYGHIGSHTKKGEATKGKGG